MADQGEFFKLIWLREAGPEAPLILSLNQPFLYYQLARELDGDLACANLHISAPDPLRAGDAGLLDRLVDEAAEMARAVAGGRPVLLLGQCVDGVLAHRVAVRLDAMGHPVHTLAMIDSWAPRDRKDIAPGRARQAKLASRLRRIASYSGQVLFGRISVQEFLSKSSLGQRALVRLGRVEPATDAELQEREINELLQGHVRAMPVAPYAGAAILFATASQTGRAQSERFGWGAGLAADAAIFHLPGWHEDALLTNGAGRIAEILSARLTRPAPAVAHTEFMSDRAMP